jgi:heterodisulfide reductase subunit A
MCGDLSVRSDQSQTFSACADALVGGGVSRIGVTSMAQDIQKGVLIIGSGVGGLKAALEVAARGRQVYLVDRSPFFGGEIVRIERQFPTNRCGLCQMLPTTNRVEEGEYCLRRDFYHPLIELIPGAELVAFSGTEGDFQAHIRQRARGVQEELCTGCQRCIEVCPAEAVDEFNCFGTHKAISLWGPQPVPPIPAIEWDACTRCGKCVEVCPTGAIDLKMVDAERELQVSSAILAPGFDEFDPQALTQYGYGRWKNVVTSIEWERIVSPLGPFRERLGRPSDGKAVKKVAFVLCVGSRERRWDFCSAACCMYAVKEALFAKELRDDLEVTVFYMDLRGFGKGYERYLEQAKAQGVRFVRGRTPRIQEDPKTKNLILSTMPKDQVVKEEFDLCVLAIGQRPPRGSAELVRTIGAKLNEWGFCKTMDPAGIETTQPGVYVCGSFSEPKDIPDTVTQATACALRALGRRHKEDPELLPEAEPAPEPKLEEEPKIGVVLCQCKGEISEGLDLEKLKEAVSGRPAVSAVMEVDALCVQDAAKGLLGEIRKQGINRLLVAACSPYWFRRRFLEGMGEMDPWLIEWVNLREGAIQAHGDEGVQKKAEAMLLMAIERLRRKEERTVSAMPVKKSALVVGAGLVGLAVASALAERGVEVHLVEREAELGGMLKGRPDKGELLEGYVRGIATNPLAKVYLKSEVTGVRGQAGDFWALIKGADGEREVGIGAIVMATGAQEYKPTEFLYGENKRVITQRELQSGLASGEIKPQEMRSVVMIQCVGSRDREHPWCNRYCCTEALENALVLKEKNPALEIYILFRDMMTYGFRERLYSQARDAGAIFLRYQDIQEIKVQGIDRLKVASPEGQLDCDLLVLSTGEVPNRDNEALARLFDLELTEDGFFKEAEPKFRPVDALREGIYLCGGAHSPRSWQEVILQAEAAAERALVLVGQEQLVTPHVVSQVVERRCSGCGLCVEACPYGARAFDEEQMVALVKEALCQGCGVCSGLCPNGAAILQGYKEDQVLAMIEAVL